MRKDKNNKENEYLRVDQMVDISSPGQVSTDDGYETYIFDTPSPRIDDRVARADKKSRRHHHHHHETEQTTGEVRADKDAESSAPNAEEDVTDISAAVYLDSGSNYDDNGDSQKNTEEKKPSGKKKTIIIASVAAAVVVVAVAAVAGFMLLNKGGEPVKADAQEFMFGRKTVVSGIDITGKTLDQAKQLLQKNEKSFVKPFRYTVDIDGEITEVSESDFEYTFNIDEVLNRAKQNELAGVTATSAGITEPSQDGAVTYEITAVPKEDSVNAKVGKICNDADKEAEDAYVTRFFPYEDTRFEFAEAIDGIKVDRADLKSKLNTALNAKQASANIKAKVDKIEADTDIDELRSSLVKLSSYETYSSNTANGTSNMKISLEACNGSIIQPDGVWSFNSCTGDSNLTSNGYKAASVIIDGEVTDGIGGGICQSSSTIYNAALRANMKVVERYNHKWASSYVPTGLDATIDYPNLDLKVQNTSKYQMFLECKVVGTTLYASFWGVKSDSYDEIRLHNELTDRGSSTYTVKEWRVYYKDGKEVDREELWSSTYDTDHGITFEEADSDPRANKDVEVPNESSESETSESSSESSSSSASSSSAPSSSAPKPTQAPQSSQPSQSSEPSYEPQTESSASSEIQSSDDTSYYSSEDADTTNGE